MLKAVFGFILLIVLVVGPAYYIIRKVIAAVKKTSYNSFLDKKIDGWLVSGFTLSAKKKDENFEKSAAQVASVIRIFLYAALWLGLVYLSPSILALF